MTTLQPIRRVLAIDPTRRGFAYAVLEGRVLVESSVLQIASPRYAKSLSRTALLVARLRPHLVAVEELLAHSQRGERARNLIRGIEMVALMKRVKVRKVSRRDVEAVLDLQGATKFEIAEAIAERFPELAGQMPRRRKPWMSEDERMSAFDAVGLAVATYEGADPAPKGLPPVEKTKAAHTQLV